MYTCSVCNNNYTRRDNMKRHQYTQHTMEDADTESINSVDSSGSESEDSIHSDDSDVSEAETIHSELDSSSDEEDVEDENENNRYDLWEYLKNKAMTEEVREKYDRNMEALKSNDLSEEELSVSAKQTVLPEIRKGISDAYTELLLLWHYANRDSVHKKITRTKRKLIEDEEYDAEEAIRYAVRKRRFLIQEATGTLDGDDIDIVNEEEDEDTDQY